MIRIQLVALIFVANGVVSQVAQACTCVSMTQAQKFARADVVAIGVVEQVTVLDSKTGSTETLLRTDRTWKNSPADHITVSTDGTCAVSFVVGHKFLLYLKRIAGGGYAADRCGGTANVEDAKRALHWLNSRKEPSERKTIDQLHRMTSSGSDLGRKA